MEAANLSLKNSTIYRTVLEESVTSLFSYDFSVHNFIAFIVEVKTILNVHGVKEKPIGGRKCQVFTIISSKS